MGSPLWMCLRRYASDQRRPCLLKIGMRLVKRQQDGPQPRIIPQMLGDRERPEGPLYNLMRCHSVLVRDVPAFKKNTCGKRRECITRSLENTLGRGLTTKLKTTFPKCSKSTWRIRIYNIQQTFKVHKTKHFIVGSINENLPMSDDNIVFTALNCSLKICHDGLSSVCLSLRFRKPIHIHCISDLVHNIS